MSDLDLSIPKQKVSAWVVETEPKMAEVWLGSLALGDTAESGREIIQALYTLNRMEIESSVRGELMELYRRPVATITSSLRSHFKQLELPLSQKKSQLAEFIRQVFMEMGYGYKCVLRDVLTVRKPWKKRTLIIMACERALYYMGQVLLSCYQVYMPYTRGVWKDVHALFHFASENEILNEAVETFEYSTPLTILQRYLQITLLGLCNPYQLPQNECYRISHFLENWGDKAKIWEYHAVDNLEGHFLIDIAVDSPTLPMSNSYRPEAPEGVYVLSAIELARMVHEFTKHLDQGGTSAKELNLGTECIDAYCIDMLQRMVKYWGASSRRQHKRMKRHGYLSLCTGINATHFFCGEQKSFNPLKITDQTAVSDVVVLPSGKDKQDSKKNIDQEYIDLAEVDRFSDSTEQKLSSGKIGPALPIPDVFRIGRWQIKDESASGLLLECEDKFGTHMRVGDFIGMRSVEGNTRWRGGVVRWMKSPGGGRLEMGVEVVSPGMKPVAVWSATRIPSASSYTQALLLPAIPTLRCPSTLVVRRGLYQPGVDIYLAEGNNEPRRVRALKLMERTNSFERLVFADVSKA